MMSRAARLGPKIQVRQNWISFKVVLNNADWTNFPKKRQRRNRRFGFWPADPPSRKKSFCHQPKNSNIWKFVAENCLFHFQPADKKLFFREGGSADQNPKRRLRRWRFLGKFVQSASFEQTLIEIQNYGPIIFKARRGSKCSNCAAISSTSRDKI